MYSMKTRYALISLIRLARDYGNGPVSVSLIAEQERIPVRFLEVILLELKNNGYVDSVRGKSGGYHLTKDPAEIRLASIVSMFEGSISLMPCLCTERYRPCEFNENEETCKLRKTFKHIHEITSVILTNTSFKDLV
jgi:Rrf2 family protein